MCDKSPEEIVLQVPLQTLPHFTETAIGAIQAGWARFWAEDPVSRPLWDELIRVFLDYHVALLDKASGRLAAIGLTAP